MEEKNTDHLMKSLDELIAQDRQDHKGGSHRYNNKSGGQYQKPSREDGFFKKPIYK